MAQEPYNLASLIVMIVGFLATLISFWFLYRQIVAGQRTRETDVLVRLYEISTREPLGKDFDLVWDLRGSIPSTTEAQDACLRACLFFEMVGSVVSQRYIDTVLIEEYFGSLITGSYDSLRGFIENQRAKPHNNKFAINFERLAIRMQRSARISRAPGQHESIQGPTKPTGKAY